MITRPIFDALKNNYRTSSTQIHACKMHFPNTYAIRMSEALGKSNNAFLDIFKRSGKNVCPHGYIRGARDLAAVLKSSNAFGKHDLGWVVQPNYQAPTNITGVKGIICFMNIPGYSGQGHIDLYDGQGPIGQEYWSAATIWMWRLP